MSALAQLETTLANIFKPAPNLPKNVREALAKAWPWVTLVCAILQLLGAWALWGLLTAADRMSDYAFYYTRDTYSFSSGEKMIVYAAAALLVVEGVLLLMAFSELQKRSARGWRLVFLVAVLNVLYSITVLLIRDRGFGSFFLNGIASVIGFYLLFQLKPLFKAKARKAPRV